MSVLPIEVVPDKETKMRGTEGSGGDGGSDDDFEDLLLSMDVDHLKQQHEENKVLAFCLFFVLHFSFSSFQNSVR